MTQLGELSLWLALLMSAWAVTLSVQGALLRREALATSGARGVQSAFLFSALALAGLTTAFVTNDFSLRYVALHSSGYLPPVYKVAAIWSGAEGASLVGVFFLALFSAFATSRFARRDGDRPRAAWKCAVLAVCLFAALAYVAFRASPYARIGRAPADGRGLDPILQHPLMLGAPPLLLGGTAALAVPVALALASRITRRRGGGLGARLRSAALFAWAPLTVALLLTSRWAYVTPQLRGYWNHEPQAILICGAWLALTAGLCTLTWKTAVESHATALGRRASLFIAACGLLLCIAALVAQSFAKNYDAQLGDGEQYRANDAWGREWTFTSQGASRIERPGADVIAVALMAARGGVRQAFVTSESRDYYGAQGVNIFPPLAVPGVHAALSQDLYVVLSDAGEGRAIFRISFKPLVELVWIGGVLFALGGTMLFWPQKHGAAP